ncbi:MFS transporter [Actinokineospora sp. PR83]|uniref:MFS transporter n=1 Tax=Actinokineospora sp. PR83 TaxID=2884908 RepID=UPI001F190AF8|nr:MFS transporter [Actinokineospora sp. PR83]MCG8916939.1 MFS transporter [Actinokineospora sp. PR83]
MSQGHRALLVVLAGNMLLDALEVSVLLPALPVAAAELGVGVVGAQWLMSGFAAGFAVFLLVGPAIGARWGRRVPYASALAVFAIASVVGALTGSFAVLVASRVVKGACAALTAPVGLGIIGDAFPQGRARSRAVGVYSLFGAVGFTAGLLFSGLVSLAGWRWVLAFTTPVAVVLAVAASRVIPGGAPAVPARRGRRVLPGTFVRAAVGAAALNGTYLGFLLLTTFTLQRDLGWQPWQVALGLLPACVPLAVSAPLVRGLLARVAPGRLIAAGTLAATVAYALSLVPTERTSYAGDILPGLLLIAAAFVLSFAAFNAGALAGIDPVDRPVAVSRYQCGVQCGAVVALVLTAVLREHTGSDRPALLLLTVCGALSVAVAVLGNPHTEDRR